MTNDEKDNLVTNLRNIRDVCHSQASGGFTTKSDAVTALAQIEKLAEIVEDLVKCVSPKNEIKWGRRDGLTPHGNYHIRFDARNSYFVFYSKNKPGVPWKCVGKAMSCKVGKSVAAAHYARSQAEKT